KLLAEHAMTTEVDPAPPGGGQPVDQAGVWRALQFYHYQSVLWKETTYDDQTKVCLLNGVASLKDAREVPISMRVRRSDYFWRIESVTSPVQRSQVRQEYAVPQATMLANNFLALASKN